MFEFQPTLEGELLGLRPLRPGDFDDVYAVASDPLIWEQHPARDRYKKPVFEELFRESLASGGVLVAIDLQNHDRQKQDALDHLQGQDLQNRDSQAQRIIGWSRYHRYDERNSEIEIGYSFLARSHWGGKYNREMKHLMLRHAFRFVESVVFLVNPDNIRSQRAMEKIGGVREGTREDASGRESVLFRIVRDGWNGNRG
jgi:N-acetyltransferase